MGRGAVEGECGVGRLMDGPVWSFLRLCSGAGNREVLGCRGGEGAGSERKEQTVLAEW